MADIWFVTHAEVVIDPHVPVPRWPLSAVGRARHAAFNPTLAGAGLTAIWASDEQKAQDGATIHAQALALPVLTEAALHENDRSATGFLPGPEFEATADAFFANPETSIRGWERAIDAQSRIVSAVTSVSERSPDGTILIVAHGGVGALLRAHAEARPISRSLDQPGNGGGHLMRLDRATLRFIDGWVPIGS